MAETTAYTIMCVFPAVDTRILSPYAKGERLALCNVTAGVAPNLTFTAQRADAVVPHHESGIVMANFSDAYRSCFVAGGASEREQSKPGTVTHDASNLKEVQWY